MNCVVHEHVVVSFNMCLIKNVMLVQNNIYMANVRTIYKLVWSSGVIDGETIPNTKTKMVPIIATIAPNLILVKIFLIW